MASDPANLHAVQWVLLDHAAQPPVQVGDIVSADAGGMPIYRVTALTPDRIRLEDERRTVVELNSLGAFRWRGAPA